MADFGDIRAQRGRWVWPFSSMEIGDYFWVAHEEREPEKVRSLAYTRGYVLGMTFKVTKYDPAKPYFTKVERIDPDDRPYTRGAFVYYGVVRQRVEISYKFSFDEYDWSSIRIGQEIFRETPQLFEPEREHYVMWMEHYSDETGGTENRAFHIHLRKDGVHIRRMENNSTFQQLEQTLALME